MDKIEKIRQKIKELKELLEDHNYYLDNSESALGYGLALDDIEQFLDTLSEEPDKSLEEVAKEYEFSCYKRACFHPEHKWPSTTKDAFIAGAEWQASQMPMPEDTVLFQKGVAEGRRLEREDMMKDAIEGQLYGSDGDHWIESEIYENLKGKEGDKVRIIVLKEEGE